MLLNLFCLNKNACGECSGCIKYLNGKHPGLLYIDALSNQAKTENLRNTVTDFISTANAADEYKAVIITDADMLHAAAQNAMLKILEEPPPRVIFVLTTSKKRKLLPTVLSRCIILKAQLNSQNNEEDIMSEFDLSYAGAIILINAACGDVDYARKLAQNDYFKIRDDMIEALDKLWNLKTYATSAIEHLICGDDKAADADKSKNTADKREKPKRTEKVSPDRAEKNLEIALIYIRDVLNYKYGGLEPANSDRTADIARHAKINDLKLTQTAEKFAELIQKMALCKGLNVRLGVTGTLFDILETVI